MKFKLCILLGMVFLSPVEFHAQNGVSKYLDVSYASRENAGNDLLKLDIYTFDEVEKKRPVIIYFHGGGWSIGDKRRNIENKLDLFQKLGYVFVSANYRLSPFPLKTRDPDRIKFPVHNRDVASAIKWVFDSVSAYGGDPGKIVLMGHSAGAHLVSLTGTNEKFLKDEGMKLLDISGIISLDSACYDVTQLTRGEKFNRMYLNAFGRDREENIQASPIAHIRNDKDHPPFLVVSRGSEKRRAKIESFIHELEAHGVEVHKINADIYTHAGVNNAIGDKNDELITPLLKDFLKKCFYGS